MSFTCAPKEQVLVTMYLSDEMLCGQQQTAAENAILTRGSQPFSKAELPTKMVYKVTNFHVYTVSNTEFFNVQQTKFAYLHEIYLSLLTFKYLFIHIHVHLYDNARLQQWSHALSNKLQVSMRIYKCSMGILWDPELLLLTNHIQVLTSIII